MPSSISHPPSAIRHSPSSAPADADEVLVRVENVGKRFCRDLKRSLFYGVQDVAGEFMGRNRSESGLRKDEFWANQDISFDLRRGECLGLVGKNGAGKTTLLKMLNGLIRPDTGNIRINGRVGALIALGAGFNPILTGKENVFIAGSVLGLGKKEIEAKYEEIVEFAELRDFMNTPVQSYSSGMQVRLGFAVASAMKPDVLLLDEVLAVGDSAFRNKCYQKVAELLEGSAVIFVTHNMAHIGRIASKVLVLKEGKTRFLGPTSEGISIYDELNEAVPEVATVMSDKNVMVSGGAKEATVEFEQLELQKGENLHLGVTVKSAVSLQGCFFYMYVFDPSGIVAAQWVSNANGQSISMEEGENRYDFRIGPINLRGGRYQLSVIMKDETGLRNLVWSDRAHTLTVQSQIYTEGAYQIPGEAVGERLKQKANDQTK